MSAQTSCRLCGEVFQNQPDRCPMCGGSVIDAVLGDVSADAPIPALAVEIGASTATRVLLKTRSTEDLEVELRQRSAAIERHQAQFQRVRAELKRRREAGDEQPAPRTDEQLRQDNDNAGANLIKALSLKVTEMEAEQARLVVEAQQAKAAQRDAENQLALVVKHVQKKREPMSRDAATELITRHRINTIGSWSSDQPAADWMVDAVVEASR